jgi:hypothetical protein
VVVERDEDGESWVFEAKSKKQCVRARDLQKNFETAAVRVSNDYGDGETYYERQNAYTEAMGAFDEHTEIQTPTVFMLMGEADIQAIADSLDLPE